MVDLVRQLPDPSVGGVVHITGRSPGRARVGNRNCRGVLSPYVVAKDITPHEDDSCYGRYIGALGISAT